MAWGEQDRTGGTRGVGGGLRLGILYAQRRGPRPASVRICNVIYGPVLQSGGLSRGCHLKGKQFNANRVPALGI